MSQGSEIGTVVYVVGSPFNQNWQHVYTAVTRGVQGVIIINDPKNLEKAIKSRPVPRKTKLKDDILGALGSRRLPIQTSSQPSSCNTNDDSLTGIDQMEGTVSQLADTKELTWASETPGQYSYHISRKNLRMKKSMETLHEEKVNTSVALADDSSSGNSTELSSAVLEMAATAECGQQDVFKSPCHKRKLSESSALLSPPETPPPFKHLAEDLSSVTPMKQTTSENKSARMTPAKKKSVIAKFNSRCEVCGKSIKKETDEISYLEEYGYKARWIHARCAPK